MRTEMYMAVMACTFASQIEAAKLSTFPAYDMEEINLAQEESTVDNLWLDSNFAQYKNEPCVLMDDDYFAQVNAVTDALSAIESATDAEWLDVAAIGSYVKGTMDRVEKAFAGTGQAVMNIGVSIAAAADVVTGGSVGAIVLAIKNSGDIAMILKKNPSEITMNDVATVAATIPILNDVVKGFSKVKDLGDRMAHGDQDACYRTGWAISPMSPCTKGRSKFLNFICMDECPSDKGMVICKTFSLMCATPDYCQYFKEEIVGDLIATGVTIAVVAGTGAGLGILTLFQQILTLTEKFAHPMCGKDAAKFKATRKEALKSYKSIKKIDKASSPSDTKASKPSDTKATSKTTQPQAKKGWFY